MRQLLLYKQNQNEAHSYSSRKDLLFLINYSVYEKLIKACENIRNNNIQEKHKNLKKAIEIIEIGLIAPLDVKIGGEVADSLMNTYISSILTITRSNVKNNIKDLEKVADIYKNLSTTWKNLKD